MKRVLTHQIYLSLFLSLLHLWVMPVEAQHTFSIVAVDTATHEVGSAGASCIDNAIIISSIHPDTGAIHTQAFYCENNQQNADSLMKERVSPQKIIAWIEENDDPCVFYDSSYRQYGVVDFNPTGQPRSAAFTGSNADDWKGHIAGYNYAIQGNILLDSTVIQDMEQQFKNTPGPLADKLMAALQGAKRPGADTRCFAEDSVSSLSAFLRVAEPMDAPGIYDLDINKDPTTSGIDPINCVQYQYNIFKNGKTFTQTDDTLYTDSTNLPAWASFNDTANIATHWLINGDTVASNTSSYQHYFDSFGVFDITLLGKINQCPVKSHSQIVIKKDTSTDLSPSQKGQFRVHLYPNPLVQGEELQIQLSPPYKNPVTITLQNLVGKTIYQQRISGSSSPDLSISLPSHYRGLHLYTISNRQQVLQKGKLTIFPR